MWSRDRWTQSWYLVARWIWLVAAMVIAICGVVFGKTGWIVAGVLLVAYSIFLLQVTLSRRRAKADT